MYTSTYYKYVVIYTACVSQLVSQWVNDPL